MLNWRELSMGKRVTGLVMLSIFVLGIVTTLLRDHSAPTIVSMVGMACIGLCALLNPRTYSDQVFRFNPAARVPLVCVIFMVIGFIFLVAGTFLRALLT